MGGQQSMTEAVFSTLGQSRSSHFKKLGLQPKVQFCLQSRQPRKKGKGKDGGILKKKMVGKYSYYFAQGLKMGRKSVVEHTVKI